ncbi:hypothetical protein KQH82_06390 [bacterium]|nr:hypothetical protein [bacterium]
MNRIPILVFILLVTASLVRAQAVPVEEVVLGDQTYPLYPAVLSDKPDIPSPVTAVDGAEYVVCLTRDGKYTIIPVAVENGDSLDYRQRLWYGKGRQLQVDSLDFPTLAATGLHSDTELWQATEITGRAVEEITRTGRPEQYSGTGFMAHDEDIVSVLKGDNVLVSRLGLTHPELAKPLFHVFNVIQAVMKDAGHKKRGEDQRLLYNGRVLHLRFWGAKGWQESIFDDEILGYWQIEIRRELDPEEIAFVSQRYSALDDTARAELIRQLSFIHTGEMVPFYIMRYGFYEGHTDYRADPIALASLFGLRTIQEINEAFGSDLYTALSKHHTPESIIQDLSAEGKQE